MGMGMGMRVGRRGGRVGGDERCGVVGRGVWVCGQVCVGCGFEMGLYTALMWRLAFGETTWDPSRLGSWDLGILDPNLILILDFADVENHFIIFLPLNHHD